MDAGTAESAPPRRERDLLDPRGWLAATVVTLVLLAATGLWQAEHYRPTGAQAWGPSAAQSWEDISRLQTVPRIAPPRHGSSWVSDLHRGLAVAFLALGAVLVATVLRWAWRRHGGDAIAVGAAIVAVGAAALAPGSGHDLIWDQLALWAVTVGNNEVDGVWVAAFDDQVRFVLADGWELPQGTYRGDVITHVLVVPAVLFGAAGVLALRLRRR